MESFEGGGMGFDLYSEGIFLVVGLRLDGMGIRVEAGRLVRRLV